MYRALKSFVGAVNMTKGEVKAIENKTIAENLIKAGYIEKVQPAEKPKSTPAKKSK